jgi:Asp-tRNA(Asn)/Glu-tRNA(Gln) amidotransferase A subunit family amidase
MRRVSTHGALPLAPSLDSIGPIARTVNDCLLIDSLIADQPLTLYPIELAGLRLAVPEDIVLDDLDDSVARAFTATLSKLSAAGVQIKEIPLHMLAEAKELYLISPYEAYPWHKELLSKRSAEYDPRVVKRILMGAEASQADREQLLQTRVEWKARLEKATKGFDAMVMPTVPIVAPKIDALNASETNFFEANRLLLRNPSIINLMDGCAISLPIHRPSELPVGLMLACSAMSDARLLSIAALIERQLSL